MTLHSPNYHPRNRESTPSPTKEVSGATKVRWLIVMMLMGFAFLAHLNRVSIAVAGSERFTEQGGMSNEQMGWICSAFLLVYTVGMLPGGWMIDRLSAC
jgi:sugar phosphate permease